MMLHVYKFTDDHIVVQGGAPTKHEEVDIECDIRRGEELFGRPFEDYARAADDTGLIDVDVPDEEE